MFEPANILDRENTGLQLVSIEDPAQGANLSWEVPEYTNILPVSLSFLLSTSATPANRFVIVAGRRGGSTFCHALAPSVIEANKNIRLHFSICVLGIDAISTNQIMTGCLSASCVLSYGEELVVIIDNIDSSDQISETTMRYIQKMPR